MGPAEGMPAVGPLPAAGRALPRWPAHPAVAGLVLALVLAASCTSAGGASSGTAPRAPLAFRAMLVGYPHADDPGFWNQAAWEQRLEAWSQEGFNALVWYGPSELTSGEHVLAAHAEFPEAAELPAARHREIAAHVRWMFATAQDLGLRSYLLTQHVFFTGALSQAHGLDALDEPSPGVSGWHLEGYPDFWRGGVTRDCGVWNETTRAYVEALYAELPRLYPELEGFYGFLGEPMPGERTRLFREAIAPGLARSGRRPRFIANQWQVPLESFVRDVADPSVYGNTWLGFHGHNSETLTDAKPYPGVIHWAEVTGLPTVVDIYPANQLLLPLNSPRLAWELVTELQRVPGVAEGGFVYWERHVSGTLLGPLFRRALARYAARDEPYSDEPWIELLAEEFGDREAARGMLRAFDLSARIVPEKDALVYSGGDVLRRELRLPYAFFLGSHPWSHMTSPARGGRLIPVHHYARFLARDASAFAGDGADADRPPYYQQPRWNVEGGSVYAVTPAEHMRRIRALGAQSWEAARAALPLVKQNLERARDLAHVMRACDLLSAYYEKKVAAAVEALVYGHTGLPAQRERALALASEAARAYREAALFMKEHLDPFYAGLSGAPLGEAGASLDRLIEQEDEELRDLAVIFAWPAASP